MKESRIALVVENNNRSVITSNQLKHVGLEPQTRFAAACWADNMHVLKEQVRVEQDGVSLGVAVTDEYRSFLDRVAAVEKSIGNSVKKGPVTMTHDGVLIHFSRALW